jgi:glycosyltransferase involved in cell wall biosynthesis
VSAGSPRITIGVPVRNGAPMIADALRSVVAQDAEDLEILVSDNVSTDATPDIIASFRDRDPRIRAVRQERTLSALEHFHWVKDQARGAYFMWAAHDDTRSPDFASALARALDERPQAVLAFGDLRLASTPCGFGEPAAFDFDSRGLGRAARIWKAAWGECFHMYGLWRLSWLRRIPLVATPWWPDLPVVTAAAALGELLHVPGPSFSYFRVIKSNDQRAAYQDPGVKFSRVANMVQLQQAAWRTCSAVGGPSAAAVAIAGLNARFAADLPGFFVRRIRERLPASAA